MTKKVSDIVQLTKLVPKTEIVELEGWTEDEPFVCELRRSSLRLAITAGKIPNGLMAAAQRLYEGNASNAKTSIKDMLSVMEIVVDDALVSPKYGDLKVAGLELTENQMSAIFSYAQRGIKAVQPFLYQPADRDDGNDGDAMEDAAQ